jgi:hypothetical protein
MTKYSIAAVALLASCSFALADQMDRGDKGAGAANSAAEHAPGQMKGSGSAKDFAPGQMKEGQSAKDYAPGHQKDNSAAHSDERGGPGRRSEDDTRSRDMKSEHNAKSDASDRNAKSDRDAARSERAGEKSKNERADDRSRDDRSRHEQSRSETRKGGSATGASEGTEGRADRKGSITSVSEEQKTRVKSAFSRHHVEPARNLNVSVNVGVTLPHSVHLYPIPEDIVLIVPEYRGYEYIMLDDDRVAIVDPDTFEVVDIIGIA